jgi:hypothetical protein
MLTRGGYTYIRAQGVAYGYITKDNRFQIRARKQSPGAACSERVAGLKKGQARGLKKDDAQDHGVPQKDPRKGHCA